MAGVTKDTFKQLLQNIAGNTILSQGVIFVVFVVVEHFYADENFKCPCYEDETYEDYLQARSYSIVFIVMTTLGAGFTGFIILSAIRCTITFGKDDTSQPPQAQGSCINFFYGFRAKYCCTKFGEACVICMAWFSLLLLDGDYIACASVPNPYGNASCPEIRSSPHNQLPFTDPFTKARRISQYIGIGFVAVAVSATAVIKFCSISFKGCNSNDGCCKKCCSCEYDEKLDIGDDGPDLEELLQKFKSTARSVATEVFEDEKEKMKKILAEMKS